MSLISITAISQNSNEKETFFHLSVIPPLSTNGKEAKLYTNDISINLLAGVSKNENIFTLAGLGNIIGNNANGLQLAGLGNIIGGNAYGIQLSGLGNIIGNNAQGIQLGGIFNIIGNNASGGQFAGIANINGANASGIQFAGLANITGENNHGVQFAGLANIAGESMSGIQFAGLYNAATSINGIQFAGLANNAKHVNGGQIAAIYNKAGIVKGFQFAGLVNIADENDYPIGLINIIKNGEKSIGASYNETGAALFSFRSGGRVLYGIVGLGYGHKGKEEVAIEGGFGAHINISSKFRINNELKGINYSAFNKKKTWQSSLSIMPAFRLTPNWEIFAGPSINYLYSNNTENGKMFPSNNLWKKFNDSKLQQIYIGYSAGIQCLF